MEWTSCPIAVAYLAYLVRKFQQNGVVEWWSDGKMEITDEKRRDYKGRQPTEKWVALV